MAVPKRKKLKNNKKQKKIIFKNEIPNKFFNSLYCLNNIKKKKYCFESCRVNCNQ